MFHLLLNQTSPVTIIAGLEGFEPLIIEKSISVVSMEIKVDIDLSQKSEGF